MDTIINNPMYFNLLWVVLAVGVLLVVGLVKLARARKRFADAGLWRYLLPNDKPVLHKVRAGLLIATLTMMTLAMADIRWGKQWTELPQRGIDIMFVVDVSRSMLARDARPNRLGRAKQYIRDVMDEMGGDRAGLVVFAGKAKQKVPLTSNYSDLSMALEEIEPQSVPRGGSRVGEAIRVAADCFVDKLPNHKAILVFSDGEDQSSYPVEAAKAAHDNKGIRVFTVGLGDAKEGARIPVRNVGDATLYLKYQGKEVWSKMMPDQLQAVALAGGGAFIPAGTKQVNMADVYHGHIAEIPQREFHHARVNQYLPRYQWFAGAALLFLLLETLPAGRQNPKQRERRYLWDRIHGRRKKAILKSSGEYIPAPNDSPFPGKKSTKQTTAVVSTILVLISVLGSVARADSPRAGELVHQANEALAAGQVDEAITTYAQAARQIPDAPRLKYNQGVAQYRKGQYEQARKLLAESLSEPDATLEAKAKFNLGNCEYAAALQHVNKKEKDKAIQRLEKAITQYTEALEADDNDTDARANIELAQRLIDQLKQEQKQQQQQKKNQNKQKQKNKSDSKANPQDDQKQQKNQSKPSEQKKRNEKQQPKSNDSQKKQPQKQIPKKPEPKQSETPREKKQDKKQQPQKQPASATDNPQHAKGKSQPGDQRHVEPQKIKRKVPPDQARRMLQAVRDKNLQRRREKQRQQRALEMPVEKDW
ncbi:MAG: VWA domain-containing protein [Phycisphaerae bacterium]|nr:VWA domain-containing protein [Phycisphaerae bacterium]